MSNTESSYPLTLDQTFNLSLITLESGLVPYIASQPGVGKSALAKKIAKHKNWLLIDTRLAGYDPTDVNGFPMVNKEDGRAFFAPSKRWPLETDELPFNPAFNDKVDEELNALFEEGAFTEADVENGTQKFVSLRDKIMNKYRYDGFLILLDELPSAPQSVQAAAYQLILDKEVAEAKLHPKANIMAAGNRMMDNAIASRLGTAIKSRVVHYEVVPDEKSFINWAESAGLNPRVLQYVKYKPQLTLNSFDPKSTDRTFSCSRTLEFLSKQVDTIQKTGQDPAGYEFAPLYVGTIGEAAGNEFRGFMAIFGEVLSIEEILADPVNVKLPSEISHLHAVSALVGEHLELANAGVLMQFVTRLTAEFQTSIIRSAVSRDRALAQDVSIRQWLMNTSKQLSSI